MEGDRHLGMGGIRPTPYSVLDRWSERERLSSGEHHEAMTLIRALDGECLAFQREQEKRRERQAKSKPTK